MMMGVEIVMQHFCKAAPLEFYPGIQRRSSDAILHTGFNVRRKKGHPQTVQYICHLKGPKTYRNIFTLWKAGAHSHGKATADRLDRSICRCQQAESVSEVACDDKNGAWFKELGNQASQYVDEVGNYNKLDTPPTSKYSSQKQRETLVEDEAWNLLKDSVAYYCGSPIGTIAANDPSDANVLNYDQVFIRDFIPSGIAFLLKGEYDIVRNFILHTLQLQALFYSALLCAREMLAPEDGSGDLLRALNNRLIALSFHIREYYWIDMRKLNEIYRYKTEEYSYDAINKFNIYPEQVSPWLVQWMPDKGGYFIGNLQPAHMDFRFFSLGNLWSIVCNLATTQQSHAILDLIEAKWSDLVANMPFKICYPALEGQEWAIITGCDPKNTPWSYHNGGSWPTLLWQLTVACVKMGRQEIAARAVEVAEKRLSQDKWPEYYDTKRARFIGKQARLYQTWTIAGFLAAKELLANPDAVKMFVIEEDAELVNALSSMFGSSPRRKRGSSGSRKSYIV